MVRDAIIIDPRDRDLEAVLRECGINATSVPPAGLAALAHSSASQPGLLVLDLRGSSNVLASLGALKRQHPSTPVAAVLSSPDPHLLMDAMRAGVNEVLIEPLSPKSVADSLGRLQPAVAVKGDAGKIFAFVGAKGGVGTTTAAVNVATALSRLGDGEKTLLVDLHVTHGDAAVFFGVVPRFSVVDAVENTHRLDEAFFGGLVTPTKAGPDLLASSDRAVATSMGVEPVRALLRFAAGLYRYIVLDVPRSDAAALDGLDGASNIVIVANQELPTVRNAGRIALALRQRYGKERVKIVLNRYDQQADIAHEDVEKVIEAKIRHSVPSDYRMALQSLNRGRPLTVENHNKLSAAYVRLAEDLSGAVVTTKPPTADAGLLGWFAGKRRA